jgi:hypothetical protein
MYLAPQTTLYSPSDDTMLPVDTGRLEWENILLAIPLSEQVFIAGGAATWLAERAIFGSNPDWTPTDIDIFICAPEDLFTTIVLALIQHHIDISGAQVVRRRGIIDVRRFDAPHCSFIRCPARLNARAVVSSFDINVCKPLVTKVDGNVVVIMTSDVEACIRNRTMHGIFAKKSQRIMQYPMAKTLNRLSKYQTRGYVLGSLTFLSVMNMDFPEEDCLLQVDDFRSLVMIEKHDHDQL